MHLVAGATGSLGGEICRRLRKLGHTVRALARETSDPAKVASLEQLGVEVVRGDLRDRESLARACSGVDAVISTVTTIRSRQEGDEFEGTDELGHAYLIDAAARANVRRFVYVSFSGGLGGDDGLTRSKRAVENRIIESGLRHSILRPTFFMEVWLGPPAFDFNGGRAVVFGEGRSPVSWISVADVAEIAVQASLSAGPSEILELGGPDAISRLDAVRTFEKQVGRTFELQHVAEDDLAMKFRSAPNEVAGAYAALQLACARGDTVDSSEALERYPITRTTVLEYARRVTGGN